MKKILYFNIVFNLFFISFCLADENSLNQASQGYDFVGKNAYEPNYFAMILGLFLVVGMIYLSGFLYQKLTKVKFSAEDFYQNKVQIISTTSLGQGRNLHVVKFEDDAFVVGATQNNITFIKDIKLSQKRAEVQSDKNG